MDQLKVTTKTHNFHSKLDTAQRGEYTFKVDAMYWPGSNPRPVCAMCWSRLDPEWGKGHSGPTLDDLQGSCGSEPYIDKTGEKWLVWEEHFRCCNPDCDAAALVRYLPAKLSFENPYHPEDAKTYKIKSKKWKDGKYDDDGLFLHERKGVWSTLKRDLGTRGVELEFDTPWLYIHPGELAEEITHNWTWVIDEKEKRWLKTSVNSKRFKEIRKWFAERRVKLQDLIDEELPR